VDTREKAGSRYHQAAGNIQVRQGQGEAVRGTLRSHPAQELLRHKEQEMDRFVWGVRGTQDTAETSAVEVEREAQGLRDSAEQRVLLEWD